MTPDKYTSHIDLTEDVSATVKVYGSFSELVHLSAGGDLHITIAMEARSARALGEALIAAANASEDIA